MPLNNLTNHIYIYSKHKNYEQDLALIYLQGLICYKYQVF